MFYNRFTGHDFLQVVFIFCSRRSNYKGNRIPFDMMTLLFGIKDVIWWSFYFQNKDTITLRQSFLSIYILCKSDEASYILGYR